MKMFVTAVFALSAALVAAPALVHAASPDAAEVSAEKDCISQYREAHKTGRTSQSQSEYVQQCLNHSGLQKDQGAVEKDCNHQYLEAHKAGKTTMSQQAYVRQCMSSH